MTTNTLVLYFGNRGFFPEKLVAEARRARGPNLA
jgi:hypothetical protein